MAPKHAYHPIVEPDEDMRSTTSVPAFWVGFVAGAAACLTLILILRALT